MYESLKNRGRAASDYYAGRKEYFSLSPAGLSLLQGLVPLLKEHCSGKVLDAGAGRGAYRELIKGYAGEYVGLDIAPSSATAVVGDAQKVPFADNSFDTVFCSQVLEHLPYPALAIEEFKRVLKPTGTLVITAPHISWLHNEPHDYFRFTRYGLGTLINDAGFYTVAIKPAGGLLSLLGHVVSTMMVNVSFGIPLLHEFVKFVNNGFVHTTVAIDSALEKKKIFALNYIAVCTKEKQE